VPESAPSNDREPLAPATLAVVLLLFFFSGFAALIYQIVWLEQLSLVIGSSALSLGLLLAVFMAGLGLGSWLASRARPPSSPLRRYALIEALIGALGVVALGSLPLLG